MQAAKPALSRANAALGRAAPLSHTSLGARLSRNQAEDFPAAELRAGKVLFPHLNTQGWD